MTSAAANSVSIAILQVRSLRPAHELAGYSGAGDRDTMAILEEFTRSLEEQDRAVFVMCLDKVSQREIAETLSTQEANLPMRLSRVTERCFVPRGSPQPAVPETVPATNQAQHTEAAPAALPHVLQD